MTGRDVPTRQKTLSVAFSVIMVMSMMAIGGAAFAGSAAGDTLADTPDNTNATITANPADYDTDASGSLSHVVVLEADNNLDQGDLSNGYDIVIDYGSDFTYDADSFSTSNINAELVDSTGSVKADIIGDGTPGSVTNDNGNNNLTITTATGSYSSNIAEGDLIRITLDISSDFGTGSNFAHPSEGDSTDVTVDVQDGSDNTQQTEDISLDLGTNAPIEVDDVGGGNSGNFSSLTEAVSAIGDDGEQITIRSNASELESQPAAVGSISGVDVDANGGDFTITSESDLATVSVPDSEAEYIDLTEDNNITVDTVGFAVDDRYTGGTAVDHAIEEGTGTGNLTVIDSEFDGFNGAAIDVALDQGADADDTTSEISRNVFTNVDEAIAVDASSELDDGDSVTVSSNDVQSFSGANAFTLGGLASGADLTFEANDFDGGGSGATAVSISSTSENVTITDGVINDTTGSDAISIADSPAKTNGFVEVTGTEIRNLGSAHDAVAISTASSDDVIVNDVTVDQSPSAIGVDVSDANPTVSVTDSLINNTDIGVDAQTAGTVTISGTTIDYAQTQAVNLITPGDGADIEINGSTSIDQAASGIKIDLSDSSTVNDQRVDVNGVTVNGTSGPAVQIAGLDSTDSAKYPIVNVSDSTFTQNNQGLDITGATEPNSQVNAHFNTFEENTKGIEVDDLSTGGELVVNATFNDFLSNDEDGLEVAGQNNDDRVNANYSWWDNRDSSPIVGPYTPQNAGSQLPIPRRVYSYTRLHTGGQP